MLILHKDIVIFTKNTNKKGLFQMIKLLMNDAFKKIIAKELTSVSNAAPICPFIVGEPGIGKSSIIRSMCDDNGWHFFELLCNQLGDRADLTGCRSVKTTENVNGKDEEVWKQIFFPHQSVQDAITCAKNNPDDIVVLFLDEINRTSSDITSSILSFTTARSIGTYKFPDNVRFIVAGNDNGNVTALDSASISRFVQYALKPDAVNWMTYKKDSGVLNPYIEKVLKDDSSLIFCMPKNIATTSVTQDDGDETDVIMEAFNDVAEGFRQITTPRTIEGLNEFLNGCSIDELTEYANTQMIDDDDGEDTTLLNSIIFGHVGKTMFGYNLANIITNDISNRQMKVSITAAPKMPKSYKDIKKCTDRQTRDAMIDNMSKTEQSELLIYALYDKNDNRELVQTICGLLKDGMIEGSYISQLNDLMSSPDAIDRDNWSALINSNTKTGTYMSMIFPDN